MRFLTVNEPRAIARAALAALLIMQAASRADAQGSLQVPMQFDFLNPGARSLAVGSAFVGLADDATSAFTNPAGLILLTDSELSFELRARRMDSQFLHSGRLSGPVSNLGIDTVVGPVYGNSEASSNGLSYLSFVYPRGKWRVAAYRHEFVRLDQSFEALGVFQRETQRELALRGARDMALTAYGASTAYRITPQFTVGGGVTLYTFDLNAEFNRHYSPEFYEAPTFAANTEIGRATQAGDDTGVGFSVGGLFTAFEKMQTRGVDLVRIGMVYRKAANFEFQTAEGDISAPVARTGTFRPPDTLGAGMAVRIARRATFTGEITWVQYESLLDGYVSVQTEGSGKGEHFTVDNGAEFHGGFEYIVDAPTSPKLRIGAWRDPDHGIRYEPPANPDLFDERFAAYLPRRGGETHFTFGGGFSIRQLEINAGFDLSGRSRVFSVSSIVRFVKL